MDTVHVQQQQQQNDEQLEASQQVFTVKDGGRWTFVYIHQISCGECTSSFVLHELGGLRLEEGEEGGVQDQEGL